jgi:hypothetical protein
MSYLSKILRIEKKDTIQEIVLASRLGDGLDSHTLSTEFISDSIFIETKINNWCKKDDQYQMVYDIDSIITKFKYNENLDFQKLSDDTLRIHKEITTDKDTGKKDTHLDYINTLGKINNEEILYSFYNSSPSITERLAVYSNYVSDRSQLLRIIPAGEYLDNIELLSIDNAYFIFVVFSSTSGNSNGYLYSVDLDKNDAEKVEMDYGNFKIPDSLSYIKGYELSKDESNNFTSGAFLRSEKNGNGFYLTIEFNLIRVRDNKYILKAIDETISAE